MPRRLAAFLLSIPLWLALPAHAGLVPGACSGRPLRWECVGALTIVNLRSPAAETVRIHFHDDQNTVVEVSRAAQTQRMLVKPDGVWFQGLPPEQPAGHSPFIDWPEGAILTIYLLAMAFPEGPDTVPEQETVRHPDVGRDRIGVIAARAGDGTVRFTITERDKLLGRGEYRAGELPPPAGGFDLTGWRRGEKPVRQWIKRGD